VKEVEDQISARKAEVEKLIREMREANMESLAISPPEESKQFLDGEFNALVFRPLAPLPIIFSVMQTTENERSPSLPPNDTLPLLFSRSLFELLHR
jgi:hypothetical protein